GNDNGDACAILKSSDNGSTWQNLSSTYEDYTTVDYANGIFFIGTNNGLIFKSSDGITWSNSIDPIPTSDSILGVKYGNGLLMVADSSSNVATSADGGVTWDFISFSWSINARDFCFAEISFAILSNYILWPYDIYTWLFPNTTLPSLIDQEYKKIFWVPWLNDGSFIIIIY
ncbi:MAG: WD40/YVTN/BNR-like repeat-containing protein, partial [Exilispira sp.]